MRRSLPPRLRQFLLVALIGVVPLVSLLALTARGHVPWGSLAGVCVVTAVLVGPAVWVVRDRVSEQRREHLTLVAFGGAMVLLPVALGLSLAFGVPAFIPSFDVLIVGSFAGCLIVLIVEETLLPDRLRGGT